MALTRDQKEAQVKDLSERMEKSVSVMFAHYIGMTVAEVSDFRRQLRENEAEVKVAKKTLMKLAAKNSGLPELSAEVLEGPVACIFSFADPLSGAQTAFKFSKKHNQVQLIGGIFDGKLLSKEEAMELAKMPGRQELLAMFVGMIQSPLNTFAGMCSSPLSGFARSLSELAKQKDDGSTKEEVKKEDKPQDETEDTKKDSKETEDSEESKDKLSSDSSESSASSDSEEKKEKDNADESTEPESEPEPETTEASDPEAKS